MTEDRQQGANAVRVLAALAWVSPVRGFHVAETGLKPAAILMVRRADRKILFWTAAVENGNGGEMTIRHGRETDLSGAKLAVEANYAELLAAFKSMTPRSVCDDAAS